MSHRKTTLALCLAATVVTPSARAQNLISNGTFDTNLSDWTIVQTASWSGRDADNSPTSGSVRLMHAAAVNQIFQCVPVSPGVYEASYELFVPGGQSQAGFSVFRGWVHDTADCTDDVVDVSFREELPTKVNTWIAVDRLVPVPPAGKSILFQLFFQSLSGSPTYTGFYDNVALVASDRALALGAFAGGSPGRFLVEASYETAGGTTGVGQAVQLTEDSGYFSFFDPGNIELVVKVLNGCPLNGHHWVFTAGLTNVRVVLTVLDRSDLSTRTYVNPLNTKYEAVQDIEAFATCP